jgi:hypothetical protein
MNPATNPRVKFVLHETQCNQRIYVQEILHGKFDRISSTSLLVKMGASGPAVRTGSPVIESTMILGFLPRVRRGVKTMLPSSVRTSSGSPGRSPSLRRRGPGKTTWPFVEILVCMVRQSYLSCPLSATLGQRGQKLCAPVSPL